MKIIILLIICAVTLAYDDVPYIDVDALVSDPEETMKYMDCFLDKGPCTPVMKLAKGHMQETFSTACQKCTPREKHEAKEFFLNVLAKYPDVLADMRKKYDPDGKNFSKFAFELSKY